MMQQGMASPSGGRNLWVDTSRTARVCYKKENRDVISMNGDMTIVARCEDRHARGFYSC